MPDVPEVEGYAPQEIVDGIASLEALGTIGVAILGVLMLVVFLRFGVAPVLQQVKRRNGNGRVAIPQGEQFAMAELVKAIDRSIASVSSLIKKLEVLPDMARQTEDLHQWHAPDADGQDWKEAGAVRDLTHEIHGLRQDLERRLG